MHDLASTHEIPLIPAAPLHTRYILVVYKVRGDGAMARITAAERVYQAVYADIQAENLRPGDVVREDLIAKQYGLSRTPVREALRRLLQDGLCERHGVGVRVSRPTLDQVHEIYPVVSVLEGLAARLSAERLDAATLAELEGLHAIMQGLRDHDDHAAYVETNQRFHDIILMSTGNPQLISTLQRLRLITVALRRYQLGIGSRMHESSVEHGQLIEAFRSRDGPSAEFAMRQHVDSGHHLLASALSRTALFEPGVDPAPPLPSAHSTSFSEQPGIAANHHEETS